MWLFTNVGFFSVVQKPGEDVLTVRSRCAKDLDNLRKQYIPELSPTRSKEGTDYPYRATVDHAAFAAGLGKLAQDITYPNFKNEVARRMGLQRERIYSRVWSLLMFSTWD